MKYIYLFIFILIFSPFTLMAQMDFGDEGMTFGDEETTTETKKDDKSDSVKTEEVTAETKTEEGENSNTTAVSNSGDSSGIDFGSEGGMDFATEEGFSFDEGELKSEGKITQEEMKFDIEEVDPNANKKTTTVKEEVKIVTKPISYIERGGYFKLSYGTLMLFSPKVNGKELAEQDLIGGEYKISFGFDFSEKFSGEIYASSMMIGGKVKDEQGILYSSDLNGKGAGLALNYHLYHTDRFNFHISLGGGVFMIDESLDMDGMKIQAGGLLGIEYYFLLKHFSFLAYVSGNYTTGFDAVGVSTSASVKYTF
ncbi:hypothetical protein JXR93_03270 [bacterium]|nr:hypothetical protein [bacterium]